MKFIETWWKCPYDAYFVKELSSEFYKCIIVMFQLGRDFTHLTYQWLFVCASSLYSEPLHFASKSVEIFHASLYRWSLKNKLTLDTSPFIWKILLGDTPCCNFFPHWELLHNCTLNFENAQFVMEFIETWWKCLDETLFVKELSW